MITIDDLMADLQHRNVALWLDGERLQFRAAKGALTPDLKAELQRRKPELIRFLQEAQNRTRSQLPPFRILDRQDSLPLSFAQQRFWFLQQFEPDSPINNMPVVLRFNGDLDIDLVKKSIYLVAEHQEVFRTRFPAVNGEPIAVVEPIFNLDFPVIDLRFLPDEQRDGEALRLATAEAHGAFDLEQGPIVRVKLFQLRDQEYLLIWNMHSIICDGASSDVFYQDFTTVYKALALGEEPRLPPLDVQYVDFAQWQRDWLQGEILESQVNYWKNLLEGELPSIQLPYDRPRPVGVQTYRSDRCARMLPRSLNQALHRLSQQTGTTLFMTLLAVFEVMLYRYSQQNDLILSFASAGRGQIETERLMGFFSNTLVLRTNLEGNPTFRELLNRMKAASLQVYAHQDLPFERLMEEIQPERNQVRSPLFQIKFTLNPPWTEGRGMTPVQLDNLRITSLFGYIYHGSIKYDLLLVMREQVEGLGMVFGYNSEMFEKPTVDRMLDHMENLLNGVVANVDQRISDLPLLSATEQTWIRRSKELAADGSRTLASSQQLIQQILEAQAERHPFDPALDLDHGSVVSYGEINVKANRMAHFLQQQGLEANQPVGVYLTSSLDHITAIFAILKAGGIYVPLVLNSPSDRLQLHVQAFGIRLILTDCHHSQGLPVISGPSEFAGLVKTIILDQDPDHLESQPSDNPPPPSTSETLAAMLTVTGQGDSISSAVVNHHQLINGATVTAEAYQLTHYDRVYQFPGAGAGLTLENLLATWSQGGTFVVAEAKFLETQADSLAVTIDSVRALLLQRKVTVFHLPTSLWQGWVAQRPDNPSQFLPQLRLFVMRGSQALGSVYQAWQQQYTNRSLDLLYAYSAPDSGLTISIFDPGTTVDQPTSYLDYISHLPLGFPLAQRSLYILDRQGQPTAMGVSGELYMGGITIAQDYESYLNSSQNSTPNFGLVPSDPETLNLGVKTGDLACYLADGRIQSLGSGNQQVIRRGIRLEIEALESVLSQHPLVQQCVVIQGQGQENRESEKGVIPRPLVAYLVLSTPAPSPSSWFEWLKPLVQDYLIPSAFVILKALPLDAAFQIDVASLPEPNPGQMLVTTVQHVEPQTELEHSLAQIWLDVLKLDQISMTDDFFELGGHSLLAIQLMARLQRELQITVPLRQIFQTPTVATLAATIANPTVLPKGDDSVVDIKPIRPQGEGLPCYFIHVVTENYIDPIAQYLSPQNPIYSMSSLGSSIIQLLNHQIESFDDLQTSVELLASQYVEALLKFQPTGSYCLLGISFGGIVAYEMAVQLRAQGKVVDRVILLDTISPLVRKKAGLTKRVWVNAKNLIKLGPNHIKSKLNWYGSRLKYWIDTRKQSLTQDKIPTPTSSVIHQVINFHLNLQLNYKPNLYPGSITLIHAIDDEFTTDGWAELTQGSFQILEVPGTHLGIFEKPYVEGLIQKLEEAINSSP